MTLRIFQTTSFQFVYDHADFSRPGCTASQATVSRVAAVGRRPVRTSLRAPEPKRRSAGEGGLEGRPKPQAPWPAQEISRAMNSLNTCFFFFKLQNLTLQKPLETMFCARVLKVFLEIKAGAVGNKATHLHGFYAFLRASRGSFRGSFRRESWSLAGDCRFLPSKGTKQYRGDSRFEESAQKPRGKIRKSRLAKFPRPAPRPPCGAPRRALAGECRAVAAAQAPNAQLRILLTSLVKTFSHRPRAQ